MPVVFLGLAGFLYFSPVFTVTSESSLVPGPGPSEGEAVASKRTASLGQPKEQIGSLDLGEEWINLDDIGEFVDEEEVDIDVRKVNPYASENQSLPLPEAVREFGFYRIKEGDTLSLIAKQHQVSIDAVVSANNLREVHRLRTGEVLNIPPYSGLFYTVKSGDTPASICAQHNLSPHELHKYNNIGDVLLEGTILFLNNKRYDAKTRQRLFGTFFAHPVVGGIISSRYGMRRHPIKQVPLFHTGVDIVHKVGSPIYAVADGVVTHSGERGNYGKFVEIKHAAGYGSAYGHLSSIRVKKGQRVRKGQIIGELGNTGLSTGPHLHFELKSRGKYVNPLRFLRYRPKKVS